jgi:hypothetical protein
MRLGLLGPAHGDHESLLRASQFLDHEMDVDRAVYLDVDGALDQTILTWAGELVGGDPAETAIWKRAQRCLAAGAAEIDEYVARERERHALRIFEALPSDGARLVELLNGQVAVMIHDADELDEEDMLPAAFMLYGASDQPVVKQVGTRWFLSPGSLEHFGVMVLEDRDDGVHLVLFDSLCREVRRERLTHEQRGAPKLTVK